VESARATGGEEPPAYDPTVDDHHPVRYVDRRVGQKPLQRTAALTSLALGAAGLVLLVWFGFDNLGYLLVLLAGAALLLLAGFAALTSTGALRAMALVATVAGIGVLVATTAARFTSLGHVRGTGLAALVCLVASVACGRYALTVPPPRGDAVWAVPSRGPRTRHGVVIANPASGGGKVGSSGLEEVAREHGIELVVMGPDDDPATLALDAVRRGADALGMAGGDGSLAQVAQVAVDHDLPFVVIPAGTRNHYALDLGLDRADPTLALAAFVRGDEHRVDYATVNGRMFLNNVSLGVYAAAVEQPEYRDAKLETTLKLLPELVEKGGPCFDLHLDVPGQGRWDSAALVQVSNGVYEMAGSAFGRRRRLDGGELGVVAVDVNHGADLAAITVLAAARHPERHGGVWPWATPEVSIGSGQERLGAGVDGEYVVLEPPLELRVVRRGLRVLVPQGTAVGLARQHLGSGGTVTGLLEVAFNIAVDGPAD
jgi:diacylglycerol kinase family enzyme